MKLQDCPQPLAETEALQSGDFLILKGKTMRLNKKGKPYIEPNPPQPCRIRSKSGLIYSATKAPDGLCRCGVMLELKPSHKDYIFPTSKQATHAISHTLKVLASINAEFEECLAAWSQGPYTQDGLWECIQAYEGQWAALTSEYFGCFN